MKDNSKKIELNDLDSNGNDGDGFLIDSQDNSISVKNCKATNNKGNGFTIIGGSQQSKKDGRQE